MEITWTNVKTLPSKSGEYLATIGDEENRKTILTIYNARSKKWFDVAFQDEDGNYIEVCNVLFWMNVPDPCRE